MLFKMASYHHRLTITVVFSFVLGSYVITDVVTSSSPSSRHATFYSIRLAGHEHAIQPLVKEAVECARRCVGQLPDCGGLEMEHDPLYCEVHGVSPLLWPRMSEENVHYTRVPQCPYWEDFMEVHMNNTDYCLAIDNTANVTYLQASNLCQAKGGYLLRLDDSDKYDAIFEVKDALGLDQTLKAWIGASDQLVEGHWVHEVDGQPIDQNVFVWKDGKPSASNGADCAMFHGWSQDRFWINDRGCDQERGFICEAQLQ